MVYLLWMSDECSNTYLQNQIHEGYPRHGGNNIGYCHSVEIVRKFLDIAIQVRHVKNMPPIDFAVSDKETKVATIEKTESIQMIQNLLVSSEKPYIDHFASIFEELWKNGIDVKDKIKSIEEESTQKEQKLSKIRPRFYTYQLPSKCIISLTFGIPLFMLFFSKCLFEYKKAKNTKPSTYSRSRNKNSHIYQITYSQQHSHKECSIICQWKYD